MRRLVSLLTGLAAWLAIGGLSGCHSVDDDRIPWAPVSIPFQNVGEWNTYGVGGATDTRRFIKSEKVPSGFPYTVAMATGFGGVLLVCDYNNAYLAYDLACPVERKQTTRINVDTSENVGRCPVCGSTYDIFRTGGPLSGPAATEGYALTRYIVSAGFSGEYMLIYH